MRTKVKIEKYQETLNCQPIDGYRTWRFIHGQYEKIMDIEEWRQCGYTGMLPSDVFYRHNRHAPMGTVLVFMGD